MCSGELLGGLYAFTFQIYGDFAGYSDIARGVSRMLGFNIMENFNAPYLSRSVTEFWRRWHISLSTWLRDYLYISLGGNRRGRLRTYLNLMLTMVLGGLWHGAAWTFVAWGAFHGLVLILHRIMLNGRKPPGMWPRAWGRRATDVVKVLLTFHLVATAWILFRAPSVPLAMQYLAGILRFDGIFRISAPVLFAAAVMFTLDLAQTWSGSHTWLVEEPRLGVIRYPLIQMLLLSVLGAAIAHIDTVTPFIYFQF